MDESDLLWAQLCTVDPRIETDKADILKCLSHFRDLHPESPGMTWKAVAEATRLDYFKTGNYLTELVCCGYFKRTTKWYAIAGEEGQETYYSLEVKRGNSRQGANNYQRSYAANI